MIAKYFVEYEFETSDGSWYWLPVFIDACSSEYAQAIADSVVTGLRSKWHETKMGTLRPVIKGLNSEWIESRVKEGLKGRRSVLRVNYFELKELEPIPGWSFDRHMELIDASPKDYLGKTVAVGQRINLPVSCINHEWREIDKLLLVDVIKPGIIEEK